MKRGAKVQYTSRQIAARVAELGREISRTYGENRVDVVTMLDNAFVFAADLVRQITSPVVCHFVQAELREVHLNGQDRHGFNIGFEQTVEGGGCLDGRVRALEAQRVHCQGNQDLLGVHQGATLEQGNGWRAIDYDGVVVFFNRR